MHLELTPEHVNVDLRRIRKSLRNHVFAHGLYILAGVILLGSCRKEMVVPDVDAIAVIPAPDKHTIKEGTFVIDSETTIEIIGDYEVKKVALYLKEMISAVSTFDLRIAASGNASGKRIVVEQNSPGRKEGYSLKISEDEVRISGADPAGIFYGVQTLRQLLPPAIESKVKAVSGWRLPFVEIEDAPAYPWRGMHLDVSRHFFSVDFIKQFIDRLALYKFNTLHLHLTDDQGWRLEIKGYPELTDKGAWRVLNNQDSVCMERAGTNPDFILPEEFFQVKAGKRMYGGFYSQEEMKAVVKYASDRHITIVPEIDMPGHMNAAILANPELTCVDRSGWGKLFTIPLCPCEETTYTFVENILKEVAEIFPGEFIHIGADEVDESSWLKSPACRSLMKARRYTTTRELHGHFVNRVNNIVKSFGKKTIGWDEIIDSGLADTSVTVMYWRAWVKDAPQQALSRGHQLIMTPVSHHYFDYEPDHSTLERVYSFDPTAGLSGTGTSIIGMQANIWTEYMPTVARLDYMTMPRMIALAENGWSKNKDWRDFSNRISSHYARLDTMNIRYRLPDIPGISEQKVFIDTATIAFSTPAGVTAIHYTTDGTQPTASSGRYNKPLVTDSSMTLKLLTLGLEGRPGNRYTIRYERQSYLAPVKVATTQPGLHCRYYEGQYNSVSKISESDFRKDFEIDGIVFPEDIRENVFGLEYRGLIEVPSDGIYTFYLSSDDGSTLQIGDRTVVNHDGFHGNVEKSGQVALRKGLHPLLLRYFDGGGGKDLALSYEGPGTKKQVVPEHAFRIIPTSL
ncbi:MAG TPA: family 20 glycosylhydrolase [Ohtaekwangia sp.]|nr:family 20 glycosylhydrolase [Ohtaekwangia sp.]